MSAVIYYCNGSTLNQIFSILQSLWSQLEITALVSQNWHIFTSDNRNTHLALKRCELSVEAPTCRVRLWSADAPVLRDWWETPDRSDLETERILCCSFPLLLLCTRSAVSSSRTTKAAAWGKTWFITAAPVQCCFQTLIHGRQLSGECGWAFSTSAPPRSAVSSINSICLISETLSGFRRTVTKTSHFWWRWRRNRDTVHDFCGQSDYIINYSTHYDLISKGNIHFYDFICSRKHS